MFGIYIFFHIVLSAIAGSEPEWNETFVFTIGDDVSELTLKIMDKDAFTNDDYLGEATSVRSIFISFKIMVDFSFSVSYGKYDLCSVPLEPLFIEGSLPPTAYNVVKDQEYRGEIRVGLTFTPEVFVLNFV